MKFDIRRYTGLAIFAAIGVGLFIPQAAALKPILPYVLSFMLFLSFIKLDFSPKKLIRKEILYFPILGWGLMPLLVLLITLPLDEAFRLGVLIAIISPTALASPVIVDIAGGDRELAGSCVTVNNVLAPFVYAFLPLIYFRGIHADVSVGAALLRVSLILFIPLAAAFLLRLLFGELRLLKKASAYINPLTLLLLVTTSVASAAASVRDTNPVTLLVLFGVVFLLNAVYFAAGMLLGRERKTRLSLSLTFGHKNIGLALWFALANFANPLTVVPLIMYIISHHSINAAVMFFSSRVRKDS